MHNQLKKINICIDFNKILPLSRWHSDRFTDNFFKDDRFSLVEWKDIKLGENNFVFLYCVPDDTEKFLQSVNDDFYYIIKKKKIKILFQNEQFHLFMKNENIFKLDYSVARRCYDHNNELYWKLCNIFKRFGIGEEYFYFLHNAKGFLHEIEQMKTQKILWINSTLDLQSKHIQLNSNLMWGSEQKVDVAKDLHHHYACFFAGRPARHRHNLIKKLNEKNLLKFGKCSLNPFPDNGDTHKLPFDDLLPKEKVNSHLMLGKYFETDIFKNIFLWVAGETSLPDGYPYFTEKTVKAILYERPFISYGNPGTLAYLRDHGFKTFNEYWDESYDNEKNDDKKIEMIAEIISNICKKNLKEINQLYDNMKPLLEYNKNLLVKTDWRKDLIKFLS